MTELRIMSWNILFGVGYPRNIAIQTAKCLKYLSSVKKRNGVDAIIDYINDFSPDVLGLQEVDNSMTQIKEINNNCKMPNNYFASEKNFLKHDEGNALLSKYSFSLVKSYVLPYALEKRNVIVSRINVKNKLVNVLNTHLAYVSVDKNERRKQFDSIADITKKLSGPIILLGDFNCEPNSKEIKYFIDKSGLLPIINNPTYSSRKPKKIFDNIFVSKDIKVRNAQVLEYKASDHLPVVATLRI